MNMFKGLPGYGKWARAESAVDNFFLWSTKKTWHVVIVNAVLLATLFVIHLIAGIR